jgi:hypothetical protein
MAKDAEGAMTKICCIGAGYGMLRQVQVEKVCQGNEEC